MSKDRNISPGDPEARPRRSPHAARAVLAGLLIAPLLYEWGLLIHARWMSILGRVPSVRTPLLDRLGAWSEEGSELVASTFRQVPWRADYVVVVGVLCFLACGLLLRKG